VSRTDAPKADYSPAEIARRRDATIKAMIATPPKRHKDEPKTGKKSTGRPPMIDLDALELVVKAGTPENIERLRQAWKNAAKDSANAALMGSPKEAQRALAEERRAEAAFRAARDLDVSAIISVIERLRSAEAVIANLKAQEEQIQ
jgi:hypothetical protein